MQKCLQALFSHAFIDNTTFDTNNSSTVKQNKKKGGGIGRGDGHPVAQSAARQICNLTSITS